MIIPIYPSKKIKLKIHLFSAILAPYEKIYYTIYCIILYSCIFADCPFHSKSGYINYKNIRQHSSIYYESNELCFKYYCNKNNLTIFLYQS